MPESETYPIVPLSEVLVQDKEYVTELEPRLYPKLSVKLYGKGVVLDEPADGATVRMKRHQLAKPGQVILSEIWAKKGAIGIVPDEGAGALVTSHFFLFDIDEAKLLPSYISWLLAANYFEPVLGEKARGTTGYAAVRPRQFLECTIPLPPLDEQRRIVARIEELAALIKEAQGLRAKAREEAEALPFEALHDLISKGIVKDWALRPLSEVCEVNPSRKGRTNYPGDMQVSFVPMSAVDAITGSIAWPEARSFSEVKKGYKWFLEGDVIFARITPCMQNGKSAIAKGLVNGVGFGSTEFHVIRPGGEVIAEWIHYILRQPSFRRDAEASFKGSAGQQRVPRAFLEAYEVPIPTLDEQRRIVAYLDALQAQVDELIALQDATQAELDALLPAVLDRAFRGEL